MVRPSFLDQLIAKKGSWTEDDDVKILAYVPKHGIKTESSSGMKRCGKSCRVRWSSHMKPDLNNENFTQQEEELIIRLHAAIGHRWFIIAQQLPGRTENDIKNHWNTKLRKKLQQMGIDPVTHKPFSQVLANYGNIGRLCKTASSPKHVGTIKRDMKKNNNNNNNNNSLYFLSQLQTNINLQIPEAIPSPNSSLTSLTSACSSSYNIGELDKSPELFSWEDFLLDDVVLQPPQNQLSEQEFFSTDFPTTPLSEMQLMHNNNGVHQVASSSSTSSDGLSFMKAMLDQEKDMFLNFPGLME